MSSFEDIFPIWKSNAISMLDSVLDLEQIRNYQKLIRELKTHCPSRLLIEHQKQIHNMQLEQFKFIYDDCRQQIKEIPSLPMLLKLTEKSTKKLECRNLYAQTEKKEFNLSLMEKQIMQQMAELQTEIEELIKGPPNGEVQNSLQCKMEAIKSKNIDAYDDLCRQEEILNEDISEVEYLIPGQNQELYEIEIKEEDQFEEEIKQTESCDRVELLKHEIDKLDKQISKISNGRGKWLQGDHTDFVKIYNRFAANGRKVIQEAVKTLAMTNIQVMDHLQLYEKYLQLSKQKKAVAEEYREIQLLSRINEQEEKAKQQLHEQEKLRWRQAKQIETNIKKKQMIKQYKQKKMSDKVKMLEQHQKAQIDKKMKMIVPTGKKQQIINRNHRYIQEKNKQFQDRQQSQNKATGSKHGMTSHPNKSANHSKLPKNTSPNIDRI